MTGAGAGAGVTKFGMPSRGNRGLDGGRDQTGLNIGYSLFN